MGRRDARAADARLEAPGSGPVLGPGLGYRVRIEAWLPDGRPCPLPSPVEGFCGDGRLPPALDEALPGLGRGGRVQVRMEPARGYGAAGVPGVLPPGATVEARLTVEAVGGFLSLPT
jgi:hypothetical protein